MKIAVIHSLIFVSLLVILTPTLRAQDGARLHEQEKNDTSPTFSLTLSPGTRNKIISEYRVGDDIWMTIVMTNLTNHDIGCSGWYSDLGDMSYSFDVRDEDGKPVEKVTHTDSELDTPKHFSFSIQRGESNTDEVQLNNGYKFDRPGKYVIQAPRPDLDSEDKNGKPVVVKSNLITITITG